MEVLQQHQQTAQVQQIQGKAVSQPIEQATRAQVGAQFSAYA